MQEFRIFGPPGTGKTTTISRNLQQAAEKFGADHLMVASFTRAAAYEVAGRNKNIRNIGTLHAHGYRAIGGQKKIVENNIGAFNEAFPQYQISTGAKVDVDETTERGYCQTDADELLAEMNLYRALMVPREHWKTSVQGFARRWDEFKHDTHMIDYTDMIEIPYRDIEKAGPYRVGFFDESQDFTPLELALVRKWGEHMDYIVMAGDDDQCIYSWSGARPDVLIEGTPAKKIVLKQSYRVPRAVHELSQSIIQGVSKREPKEYLPREEDGEVRRLLGINMATPERILDDMERYLKKGKTVMLLASCGYMLNSTIKLLREEGIPFHNPYRKKAGNFNPLRGGGEDSVPSYERLLNFYETVPVEYRHDDDFCPVVDGEAVASWFELLKTKDNIPHGMKDLFFQTMRQDHDMPYYAIGQMFLPESGIHDYLGRDCDKVAACRWYIENIIKTKQAVMEYPLNIIRKRGPEALKVEPKVIVGTIHSVKGGEADVVYLIPDMSYAGYQEKVATVEGRDAATRLLYVAYTRARESLVLLDSATNMVM